MQVFISPPRVPALPPQQTGTGRKTGEAGLARVTSLIQ